MTIPRRVATRLALEGLVIVASILAAFGLDTAWDRAQEREDEHETLVALQVESQEAAAEIPRRRGFQQRILASLSAVADSHPLSLSPG